MNGLRLSCLGTSCAQDAVQHLRDAVAGHIRDHADEYAPYLEFEAADGAETDPSGT